MAGKRRTADPPQPTLFNDRSHFETGAPMLQPKMPALHDLEGSRVPAGLPPVIDAHVHIFPDSLFAAIQRWFAEHAWPIRYQMRSSEIFEFLFSRGVEQVIALQYAHKPGIARDLNAYMAEQCRNHAPRVTGLATVFPGEADAEVILQEAFDAGLDGLKLHAHVQCFDLNADAMQGLYACCRQNGKPIVMHVGREPRSTAYNCDPYELCSAEKLERVLKDHPGLKVCVPHLGFDELAAYRTLIEQYDTLWLDTTMLITDYFPLDEPIHLERYRSDRIMYGSDFPNIPYAWDRELKALEAAGLSREPLEQITYTNAVAFFGL
ncbi:MAG: amidohydrolase [Spirochaetales bacterium]|nr:amidohydrolase [Spirochaetales bacterium]